MRDNRETYLRAVHDATPFVANEHLKEWTDCPFDTGTMCFRGKELVLYKSDHAGTDVVIGTLTCTDICATPEDGLWMSFDCTIPGLPSVIEIDRTPTRIAEGVWMFLPRTCTYDYHRHTDEFGSILTLRQKCSATYYGYSRFARLHSRKVFEARGVRNGN